MAVVLGITAILAAFDLAAWWVAPVVVPILLYGSLRRALRQSLLGSPSSDSGLP